jgi:hypothetical protein
MNNKHTVLDYLWLHSRFNAICLFQSEELYRDGKGFSSITILFSCLENVAKSVVNDYNSNLYTVFKKLHDAGIITAVEHNFLNVGDACIRKIRNLYAHANVSAINLVNIENGKEVLYPLTEDETSLLLYEKISDIIYNLILKCICSNFIDDVKNKYSHPLDDIISQSNLAFKTLSVEELLILKGYPGDYIPDNLNIPEDMKYRMVDNAPDVNERLYVLSRLENAGLFEALRKDPESD